MSLPPDDDMLDRERQAYYPTAAERLRIEKLWADVDAAARQEFLTDVADSEDDV